MRTYHYFGPSTRLDGPPFHVWLAAARLPGVDAYRFECHGDPALFGKADLHVAVDWAEDVLGYDTFVEPRPLVYWMSDTHITPEGKAYRFKKAERADVVFCSVWSDPEELSKRGIKARWLPYAAEPDTWKPRPDIEPTKDIVFIGHYGNYPAREVFLEDMCVAFPSFEIRGGVYWEEASKLMHTGRVVLNHCQADAVNLRLFEALSNGQCLLTPHTSDLEYLGLEDGMHLLTYRNTEEAVAKCKAALADTEWRETMGNNGREWLLDGHTYLHRACAILDVPVPENIRELALAPIEVSEKKPWLRSIPVRPL